MNSVLVRLLDELPVGVVLLDADGRIVHFNRVEEHLAGRSREAVLGKSFFGEVAPCMNVKRMGGQFEAGIGRGPLQVQEEFSFAFPHAEKPRVVNVRMTSFELEGRPYATLFVEDVSQQRALDRMKETLGQLLVHDLKNPLASIFSNLDFIESGPLRGTPEVADALRDIGSASRRLHAMVMNLLDVTSLETGAVPVRRQPLDLAEVARAAVAEAQAVARDRHVALIADLPADGVPIQADGELLRRAAANLIENAIRHAPQRSPVVVRARSDERSAALEVEDEGAGVPPELRETIFGRYAQLESSNRGASNRGLGLTFVRLVARAHGGDATVEAAGQRGSRFRIELPR